jgi:hypothetical protein
MRRIFFILFILGLIALSLVGGAILTYFRFFPYAIIHKANLAAHALYDVYGEGDNDVVDADDVALAHRSFLFNSGKPAALSESRLLQWEMRRHEPGAGEGLTLVCSSNYSAAHLLDGDGRVAHSWSLRTPVQSSKAQRFEDAYLYPNGDMLVAYVLDENQHLVKLVKIDKDSNVLWIFKGASSFNHRISVGEDGTIYSLINPPDTKKPAGGESLNVPFLHDHIIIMTADGREVKRFSLIEAFAHSPYAAYLDAVNAEDGKGDYLHANDVEPLSTEMAAAFPQFKPGYLLTSLRNISTIAVIDPRTESVVWAMRGPWLRQHDPDFLPNGNILLFDNLGDDGAHRSRLLEVDTKTGAVIREYGQQQGLTFYSFTRGMQQMLPGGDLLVAASQQARVIEWNRTKGIVWDVRNPRYGVVTCMRHFAKGDLHFPLAHPEGAAFDRPPVSGKVD